MWNLRQWDSHKQRWFTGLLLLIPLIFIITVGPLWAWLLIVAAMGALGLWEFQGMLFREGLAAPWQILNLSVGLLLPLAAAIGRADGLHFALVFGLFCGFFSLLAFSPGDADGLLRFARLALGWLYIPYLLSYVLLIGPLESGRAWAFYLFVVAISDDAGAYYCGRILGRHKLYERVSPKKTVEGSLGGLAFGVVLGTLFGVFFLRAASLGSLILLSAVLAMLGQAGDLIESMIKRMSGKKDSSQILPGHGGILDRLDSLLFTSPALWLYLRWLG